MTFHEPIGSCKAKPSNIMQVQSRLSNRQQQQQRQQRKQHEHRNSLMIFSVISFAAITLLTMHQSLDVHRSLTASNLRASEYSDAYQPPVPNEASSLSKNGRSSTTAAPHSRPFFSPKFHQPPPAPYMAATTEQYFIDNARSDDLLFHEVNATTCRIWRNKTGPVYMQERLHRYLGELEDYNQRLADFRPTHINVMSAVRRGAAGDDGSTKGQTISQRQTCKSLRLHPEGHDAIFSSQQLSTSPTGYIEPLLPPLRHPSFCVRRSRDHLMDLSYLVHDFEAICNKLKPHSRIILMDLGASLDFHHRDENFIDSPAMYLVELYKKFGIHFDHIYAYETTPTPPAEVFQLIPDDLLPAYHWINMGVSAEPGHKLNPWKMALESFTEDDLVIVKLDIDTPEVELPLTQQLLQDPRLHKIVDHFYFEHHVAMRELLGPWGPGVHGTVEDSFNLFHELREKGVAAHSWV